MSHKVIKIRMKKAIGGQGIEEEIDESKFGRQKYNRGRWQEVHWVFGGKEGIMGKAFMVEISQREAATLIPIIQQYIRFVFVNQLLKSFDDIF